MRMIIVVCMLIMVLALAALEVVASHRMVEPLVGSPTGLAH